MLPARNEDATQGMSREQARARAGFVCNDPRR
jgi:hypothetical protein